MNGTCVLGDVREKAKRQCLKICLPALWQRILRSFILRPDRLKVRTPCLLRLRCPEYDASESAIYRLVIGAVVVPIETNSQKFSREVFIWGTSFDL